MFFYINWTYILMVLPAFIFAIWASSKVNSTFNYYSKEYSRCNETGSFIARKVLDKHGLTHIRIEKIGIKETVPVEFKTLGRIIDIYDYEFTYYEASERVG